MKALQQLATAFAAIGLIVTAKAKPPDTPVSRTRLKEDAAALQSLQGADIRAFKDLLSAGVQRKLWTEADRTLAEETLESMLGQPRQAPAWRSTALMMGQLAPRITTPLEQWLYLRLCSVTLLRTKGFQVECHEAAEYFDRLWAESTDSKDLTPAVRWFAELEARESDLWRSANIWGMDRFRSDPFGTRVRDRMSGNPDFMAEAFAAWSIAASSDGFIPPNPAQSIPEYLKWRETWRRLARLDFPFVRGPHASARFDELDRQYRQTLGALQDKLAALIARGADTSELHNLVAPLVKAIGAGDRDRERNERMAISPFQPVRDYHDILERRGPPIPSPRAQSMASELDDVTAQAIVSAVHWVTLTGNSKDRPDMRPSYRFHSLEPTLRAAVLDRVSSLQTKEAAPAVQGKQPIAEATPLDALFHRIESLDGATRASPGVGLATALRSLQTANSNIPLQTLSQDGQQWASRFSRDSTLVPLREQAARELFAKISGQYESGAAPLPLAALWESGVERALGKHEYLTARRLIGSALALGLFADSDANRWTRLVDTLPLLQDGSKNRAELVGLCSQIISEGVSPAGTQIAVAKLKTLH